MCCTKASADPWSTIGSRLYFTVLRIGLFVNISFALVLYRQSEGMCRHNVQGRGNGGEKLPTLTIDTPRRNL